MCAVQQEIRCVTGSEDFPGEHFPDASNYLRELSEVPSRRRPASHLKAPAKDSFCFGCNRVEALHFKRRLGSEVLRCGERRVHCNAERAVVIGRGGIVGVLLLERGELSMRVRNLRRAHDSDDQQTENSEHTKPCGPVFAKSELEECLHEREPLQPV